MAERKEISTSVGATGYNNSVILVQFTSKYNTGEAFGDLVIFLLRLRLDEGKSSLFILLSVQKILK